MVWVQSGLGHKPANAPIYWQLASVLVAVDITKGVVSVRDLLKDRRPKGHPLLRMITGGICHTDLELQRGYYGFSGTHGHEFVAEVAGRFGLLLDTRYPDSRR